MEEIFYQVNDANLRAKTFLSLVNRVWPGIYDPDSTQAALNQTLNIAAWHKDKLIGCVRLLTDGYFFSTITEILVDPAFQKKGVGARLMDLVWQESPTSLSFGVQPGNEPFFEKLGFERGLDSFQKKKSRN